MPKSGTVIEANAGSYYLSYKCLMKKDKELRDFYSDNSSTYFLPSMTVASFSCELALKALIDKETGKNARGHNLMQLFNKLSQDSQNDVMDRTIKLYNEKTFLYKGADLLTNEKFHVLLNEVKNTFVDCRYFHEGKFGADYDFLEALMFCLNNADGDYENFLLGVL